VDRCVQRHRPARRWLAGQFRIRRPFTEMVLLGNLAIKVGQKIEYDAVNMKVTNVPEANKFLRRKYRKGWRHFA